MLSSTRDSAAMTISPKYDCNLNLHYYNFFPIRLDYFRSLKGERTDPGHPGLLAEGQEEEVLTIKAAYSQANSQS